MKGYKMHKEHREEKAMHHKHGHRVHKAEGGKMHHHSEREHHHHARKGHERGDHGDEGFVGERAHKAEGYSEREGAAVDRMLTSENYISSNMATIRCAMKHSGHDMDIPRGDKPKGREPKMSGPAHMHHPRMAEGGMAHGGHAMHHSRHKMAAGGIGKVRKGVY